MVKFSKEDVAIHGWHCPLVLYFVDVFVAEGHDLD